MAENRFAKYVQAAPAGDPVIARDPYKASAEARAGQDQEFERERLGIERERLGIARQDAQRQQQETTEKRGKLDQSRRDAADTLERVFHQLTDVAKSARDGWGDTGRGGAFVRGLPTAMSAGSDAYDLQRMIDTVDANSAFSALQKMRDNSPTGGALGQVTEKELELLKSSIVSLDPNQSQEQLMKNIVKAKQEYVRMLRRVDPERAQRFIKPSAGQKAPAKRLRYNPATGELE